LAVLAIVVALTLAACQRTAHGEYVRRLEAALPVLSVLHVTEFRDQDWCVNLAYARGAYSRTTSHSTCDLFPGAALDFDGQASSDLQLLRDAFHKAGVKPIYGEVVWAPDGTVTSAYFEVECVGCATGRYIFDSAGAQISEEPGEGTTEIRVSDNWSWYEER
jgi:hypothetical protein